MTKGIQTPMARGRSTNYLDDRVDSDQEVVNKEVSPLKRRNPEREPRPAGDKGAKK